MLQASWHIWLEHDHDTLQRQRSSLRMLQVAMNHCYRGAASSAFHQWRWWVGQRHVLERVVQRQYFWSLSRRLHYWRMTSVNAAAEESNQQLQSVQRELMASRQTSGALMVHAVLRQLQSRWVLSVWRQWMLFVWGNLEEELRRNQTLQQLRSIVLIRTKTCVVKALQKWRQLLNDSKFKRRQLRTVALFWGKSMVTQALQLWKDFLAEKESNEQWLEEGLSRLASTLARMQAHSVCHALYQWRMFSQSVHQTQLADRMLRHEGLQLIRHTCLHMCTGRLAASWSSWVQLLHSSRAIELEDYHRAAIVRHLAHSMRMRALTYAFQQLRAKARSHALNHARLARIRLLVCQDRKQKLVRAWNFWCWFASSAAARAGQIMLTTRIHRLYLRYLTHALSQWRLVCVFADADLDCLELERQLLERKQRHGLTIVRTNFQRVTRDVLGVYLRQWCVVTRQMAYFEEVALHFRNRVLSVLLTKVTKVAMLHAWRRWLSFFALRVKQCSDLLYLSSLVRQVESQHLSHWFNAWHCRTLALEAQERYDDVAQLLAETEQNLALSQQRWVQEARTVSRQVRLWKLAIASNQMQTKMLSRVIKKWCLYIAAEKHALSQYAATEQIAEAQHLLAEAEADVSLTQERLLADNQRSQQEFVSERHQHALCATVRILMGVLHRLHFRIVFTRWHAWVQFVRHERDEVRLQQCVVSSGRVILHEAGQKMYLWHNLCRVSDRIDLLCVCRLWWRWKTLSNLGQVSYAAVGLVAAMKARLVRVCTMQLQRSLDLWQLHASMWAVEQVNESLAAQTMAFIQRLMNSKLRRMRYRTMERAWHTWADYADDLQELKHARRQEADQLPCGVFEREAKLRALAEERRRKALQGGIKSWKGVMTTTGQWGEQLTQLELVVLRLQKQQLLRGMGQWRTYCVYIKAGMKSE
jgi:hypothetical protein